MLGVKEEAGRPVIDALTKYVRDLQLLIILDNCEQVIHGCADLAKRLLQAGPQSKGSDVESRLSAGRRRNDISRADACRCPIQRKDRRVDSLAQHEAVRLFVDRAAASRAALA